MRDSALSYAAPTTPLFESFPVVSTEVSPAATDTPAPRRFSLRSSLLLAVPAAAAIGWAFRSRRAGLVAGGLTAVGLGLLRWQLARWFTETPAYEVERRIAGLELRRYPTRIEAQAQIEALDFEQALDRGFGRLACYILGSNTNVEDIEMTTPVLMMMRDGIYTMAFEMPKSRELSSLPMPDDPRIELREVPAKRIAALQFRGRFTRDNVESHERELLRRVVDAGLVARGSVAFAAYDSPATLPFLRRNELWIEIV